METNQMEITQMEVVQTHAPIEVAVEAPQVLLPWRRFWARSIDISIYQALWTAFLGLVFHVNLVGRSTWETLLDPYMAILLMLFLEPLCLHWLGTTPGKAIFGLRIKHADGQNLTYSEGFYRTWRLIGAGMGYNIPIYNLIRLWKSFAACSEGKIQPWDQSLSYTIKDTKWYRWLLFIGANLIIAALLLTLFASQLLPPNRGDLTIAEFAENYNYYQKLLDADFDNTYLDENGEWTEKKVQGTYHIPTYYGVPPTFSFQAEGGYVKGLSLVYASASKEGLIDSHGRHMTLAALAFSGAQKEVGLFSRVPEKILGQIASDTFQSFQFTEAGITFTCDIQYSGYEVLGGRFLSPLESATKYDYNLIFSIEKNDAGGF